MKFIFSFFFQGCGMWDGIRSFNLPWLSCGPHVFITYPASGPREGKGTGGGGSKALRAAAPRSVDFLGRSVDFADGVCDFADRAVDFADGVCDFADRAEDFADGVCETAKPFCEDPEGSREESRDPGQVSSMECHFVTLVSSARWMKSAIKDKGSPSPQRFGGAIFNATT